MVFSWGYVAPPGAFQGEKRVAPNHFLTPPKFEKGIKGRVVVYFIFFQTLDHLKLGVTTLVQLQLNNMPLHAISTYFQVFFIVVVEYIITSVTEKDPVVNEEALIDRYSYVFDTEITISPISVSRRNLSDNVGRSIPFLEAVQESIVPYAVEVTFYFPEFIGWCTEQYSHEERVVINKQRSKVMCRVESLSIQDSLTIPESFSTVSEPFNEEKLIRVYRECPSEV